MKFLMEQGEVWWGGTSANASCPLSETSVYHENMTDFSTSSSNQAMPLYLSSHGRYLWSDTPFEITARGGEIEITGGDPELIKVGDSLKDAFLAAQKAHFPCDGRPLPDRFFTSAQLNTWMEFTYYVTQEGVLDFAREYVQNGFTPSLFIIDEGWERRYGAWEFDAVKFRDPKAMVRELHEMGFTVLLWVVPYVSVDGPGFVRSLRPLVGTDPEMAKHLYTRTGTGEVAVFSWWNGFGALLDMTDEYNRAFLKKQLDTLIEEYGIDGFKFDGGSVNGYTNKHLVNGRLPEGKTPHDLNRAWNEFGAQYTYHEYKDTYGRGGRNMIERLRDKDHRWDGAGINTLIPCALTASLTGYPFLCPDMIGGGEWTWRYKPGFTVDEELFVRMAQVSALFPMMQFSWAPWKALSEENLHLCLDAARLHERMAGEILDLVRASEKSGEPILRPLEYVCPHRGYEKINDEFLLGDDILVAPVIKKGETERNVVFPEGVWKDEDGNTYEGGTERMLDAPISKLLWFRRA